MLHSFAIAMSVAMLATLFGAVASQGDEAVQDDCVFGLKASSGQDLAQQCQYIVIAETKETDNLELYLPEAITSGYWDAQIRASLL